MQSRRLERFLKVAEKLSFRAAAQELNLAQPALSRSIAELEKDLGTLLFVRQGRRVFLTPAGEVLQREGTQAVQQLARAEELTRIAAADGAGKLRVGYGVFASLGPMSEIVLEFNRLHPMSSVRLFNLATTDQLTQISTGQIDLGFAFSLACLPPWQSRRVSHEDYVLLASRRHPLAARKSVNLVDLSGERFVLGNRERWGPYRNMIDGLCSHKGFLPNVVDEADDLPILMALLSSGMGIALHGAAIRQSLPPGIVAIPLSDANETVDISLVWSEGADAVNPLIRNFINVADTVLAGVPRIYKP
ncbi:LysR family transcriptional regulator [Rhodobacteraceae bacterium KMM 6894]|nr:LysR family transcriptional regulator [Rhodobacteraceae bacterium KMM 6894]